MVYLFLLFQIAYRIMGLIMMVLYIYISIVPYIDPPPLFLLHPYWSLSSPEVIHLSVYMSHIYGEHLHIILSLSPLPSSSLLLAPNLLFCNL